MVANLNVAWALIAPKDERAGSEQTKPPRAPDAPRAVVAKQLKIRD